jgi:hypothetical protein
VRSRSPLVPLVFLILAGCIQEAPIGEPVEGRWATAANPPMALSAVYSSEEHEGVYSFRAWSKNEGTKMAWTRGTCYTPWSWRVLQDGEEMRRGPPQSNCQPLSWAEVAPGVNQTTASGWNRTVWVPRGDGFDSGDYRPAPRGDYRIEVTYSFYRSMDESRYCCPEQVSVSTGFRLS